ncbi:MAG: aldo/keto reductase [Candidatus Poribacteria bacterium]|nr:aldo/keto reductase [Candidatus Poribacteria bacterium]
MKPKILGRTGLRVSIVGLGAAFVGIPTPNQAAVEYPDESQDRRTGKPHASYMDDELGVQTVHAAIDAGCTLIDTAALYGGTRSERIIGRALRERPDLAAKCTVTTKVGRLAEGQDYGFDAILRHVEASQQRLGLDKFEVIYIHDPMGFPMEQVMGKAGALGALRKLQDDGIVQFIGVAANEPETNARYIETGEFDAVVVPEAWSLLNHLAAERILPAAEKHNMGLVIATPLERGLLSTGPVSGINYLARNFSAVCLNHVSEIQVLCRDYDIPMVAAALQWCTRHPQVAATIPGARTPEEAVENARAGDVEIPEAFWQDLAPHVRHFEIGVDR